MKAIYRAFDWTVVVALGSAVFVVVCMVMMMASAQRASAEQRPWTAELSMRDDDGTDGVQKRDPAIARQFMKNTGHPNGRQGWIVDHVIPLCAGGPDSVENMQWQRYFDGKRKDGFERELCNALAAQGLTVRATPPVGLIRQR